MMFDQDVQLMVQCSFKALREKQARVGDIDAFPDEFKVLLNKSFLSRVEVKGWFVRNGDKAHTIHNMTDDVNCIDKFKATTLSLQDTHSDVCASGNISTSPTTPKKRQNYIAIDSGDEQDDFQMSTTKQKKVEVKIEPEED